MKQQTLQIENLVAAICGVRCLAIAKLLAICAALLPLQLFAQISTADKLDFGFLRDCSIELRWDEAASSIVDVRPTASGEIFGQTIFVSLPNTPMIVEESLIRLNIKGKYLTLPYSQVLLSKKVGGAPGILLYGLRLNLPIAVVRKKLSHFWDGQFVKKAESGATYFEFQANSNPMQVQAVIAKPRISVDRDAPSKTNLICDYSF